MSKRIITRWLGMAALAIGLAAPSHAVDIGQGLVVYYDLDETTGNLITDEAPDGTPTNGDVVGRDMSLATVAGKIGTAYHSPDNAADFISIDGTPGNGAHNASLPSVLHFGAGSYSISCWVFYPGTASSNDTVLGNVDWAGTRDGVTLFRNTSATIGGAYADGTNYRHDNLTGFQSGAWRHWVLVGDRATTTSRMYLNGVQVAQGTLGAGDIGNPAVPFVLGGNALPNASFGVNAYYDDFAVWNRPLTAQEVARIYQVGNIASPLGVVAAASTPWLQVTAPAFKTQAIDILDPDSITVQIDNLGSTDSVITAITPNKGSFSTDTLTVDLGALTLPLTIPAGTSVTLTVNWQAAANLGLRDFTLDISSDDPSLNPVPLKARVTPAFLQDLVLYYDFDETTGAVLEDKAPDATVNNADVVGRSLAAATTTGIIGQAFHAPGTTTDFVSIDGTPGNAQRDASSIADLLLGDAATGTDYTMSYWVNFPAAATSNHAVLGNVDWNLGISGNRDGIGAFRNTNTGQGIIYRSYYDAGAVTHADLDLNALTAVNTWIHFVYVVDRDGDARLYRNGGLAPQGVGALATPTPAGDIGNPSVPFVMGALPTTLAGSIVPAEAIFDEFAFWHRALTPEEVALMYEAGLAGTPVLDVVVPVELSEFQVN